MDYQQWLSVKYAEYVDFIDGNATRLGFLATEVFGFTTYCDDFDEEFATRALEVVKAITGRTIFEYIRDDDRHRWYLLMCNMPFFRGRLEWGTSIRGAWWEPQQESVNELEFEAGEWPKFCQALLAFAAA